MSSLTDSGRESYVQSSQLEKESIVPLQCFGDVNMVLFLMADAVPSWSLTGLLYNRLNLV